MAISQHTSPDSMQTPARKTAELLFEMMRTCGDSEETLILMQKLIANDLRRPFPLKLDFWSAVWLEAGVILAEEQQDKNVKESEIQKYRKTSNGIHSVISVYQRAEKHKEDKFTGYWEDEVKDIVNYKAELKQLDKQIKPYFDAYFEATSKVFAKGRDRSTAVFLDDQPRDPLHSHVAKRNPSEVKTEKKSQPKSSPKASVTLSDETKKSQAIDKLRADAIRLVKTEIIDDLKLQLQQELVRARTSSIFSFTSRDKCYPALSKPTAERIIQNFGEKFQPDSTMSPLEVIQAAQNGIDHAKKEAKKYLSSEQFVTAQNALDQVQQKLDSDCVDRFYLKSPVDLDEKDLRNYVKHINDYLANVDSTHKKTKDHINVAVKANYLIPALRDAMEYKISKVNEILSAATSSRKTPTLAQSDEIMLQQKNPKFFLVYALSKALHKEHNPSFHAIIKSVHTDLMNYEKAHNKRFFGSDSALRLAGCNPQQLFDPASVIADKVVGHSRKLT